MHVPHALECENACCRSLSLPAAGNGMCLGFEMLRGTARCCGENHLLDGQGASLASAINDGQWGRRGICRSRGVARGLQIHEP
jgi:hypothetical protein